MKKADYSIHISDEKDTYIVVRNIRPHLMIHLEQTDTSLEVTRIIMMENCSPSDLGKILIESEIYAKNELSIGTRAS